MKKLEIVDQGVEPQLSIVISDLVMGLSCYWGGFITTGLSTLAPIGFYLLSLACLSGCIRFSGVHQAVPYHNFLSAFGSQVAVPCLCFAFFYVDNFKPQPDAQSLGIFLLFAFTFLVSRFILRTLFSAWETLSGATMAIVFKKAVYDHGDNYALVGGILYIVAGLLIGPNGTLFGFKRVNIFHYLLAVANIVMAISLCNLLTHHR